MTEVTNRAERREALEAGGWSIFYGDLINEADIVELIISIPTGSVAGWVNFQVQAQLAKFGQSLSSVSKDVVSQAIEYLERLLQGKRSGERDFNGLGIKAGIVTYKRKLKGVLGTIKIPNNYQPYIGLRVTSPLLPIDTQATVIAPFQQFSLHTGTELENTDETFDFLMTDWNGDGLQDLVAIKKSNTGTNSTEVHILSGASMFQQFILQTGTGLHPTDETFDFGMIDWNGDGRPDLVAIKKSNTSGSTEVHILSGASNFKDFILQTGTGLHPTDKTFDFLITDWNGDGRPDLVAVKKSNTGTNSTEVHILSGASNFQDFILHTGSALHPTDKTFDFIITDWTRDGRPDLVAIKKSNTGTNSTEVHILGG